MKTLFQGKRKFISIPLIGIIAIAFLPIAIGLGVGYLIYKNVGNARVKYAALVIIALLTLFTGSAWIAGVISPAKPQLSQTTKEVKIDYNKSQPEKPVENTTVPSVFKAQTAPNNPNIVLAKVTRIVDGDTIEVDLGNGNIKTVRYIGIDTPETVDPRKSVQCFGKEASDKNKELVGNGTVGLEKDVSETDKYGRLLRYVYMGDLFINQVLVAEGYAYSSSYPPDIKYQDKFRAAEQQAKASNKGLWGACNTSATTSNQSNTVTSEDKDCSDFKTQAEAQAFFISQGGPSKDPHRLDGNKDGMACESLP